MPCKAAGHCTDGKICALSADQQSQKSAVFNSIRSNNIFTTVPFDDIISSEIIESEEIE